jgi:hypothetical protein
MNFELKRNCQQMKNMLLFCIKFWIEDLWKILFAR